MDVSVVTPETLDYSGARLEVADLYCIRDERDLFKGLSFGLRSGQILLVEGRNGCGKTTLLRILCGIRTQESGTVQWCGEPIEELGAVYHEQLAYVGHHDGVKRELTVLENIRLARALGNPSERSIDDILQTIQLFGYEDVPTGLLSAGQRRRLALSRLLATDSLLWILDEPFTSLDTRGIGIVTDLLRVHTGNGGLVVMTSHHRVEFTGVDVRSLRLS
ncbi:MAG: cytochrome c biogenesis heme-transporting ATPase CcmA [Gammaproteobacteria bacterium]